MKKGRSLRPKKRAGLLPFLLSYGKSYSPLFRRFARKPRMNSMPKRTSVR